MGSPLLAVADGHCHRFHVQQRRRQAMAMVRNDGSARVVVIGIRQHHHAIGGGDAGVPVGAAMSMPKWGLLGCPFRMRWLP